MYMKSTTSFLIVRRNSLNHMILLEILGSQFETWDYVQPIVFSIIFSKDIPKLKSLQLGNFLMKISWLLKSRIINFFIHAQLKLSAH